MGVSKGAPLLILARETGGYLGIFTVISPNLFYPTPQLSAHALESDVLLSTKSNNVMVVCWYASNFFSSITDLGRI